MRVSKDKAAENRIAILRAASQLFRKRGIDDVDVAEIAREAGLTHGALYAHFPSKDALVAEAFSYGFEGNMADTRAWAGIREPSFGEYLNALVSTRMRDRLEKGCPLAASASEIARQSTTTRKNFTQAFETMVAMLEGSLDGNVPGSRKRQLAVAAMAAQIGAIAVARAVAKTDPALSEEVLLAVRETLGLTEASAADMSRSAQVRSAVRKAERSSR